MEKSGEIVGKIDGKMCGEISEEISVKIGVKIGGKIGGKISISGPHTIAFSKIWYMFCLFATLTEAVFVYFGIWVNVFDSKVSG